MSNMPNPFNSHMADLGGDTTIGYPKEIVDMTLRDSGYVSGTTCLICGNTAEYKLIPKKKIFNTAEIQDKGFICEHCLRMKYVDSESYGIRPLK